ncbi:MAG: class I SAM-dependent methyltransferase [Thermoleophilia bacterium]|nr:class I SAM-dependent methyltransferase [Thermoleophilia bacterium]
MDVTSGNTEAVEAWDGVLFDRFVQFRKVMVDALGAHGDEGLRLLSPAPGERVIDLGCGFGDTTQKIAELVSPGGEAFGIDAGTRFIDTATEESAAAGLDNCSFAVTDIEAEVPGDGFDAAFSRMGTMFFANPVTAMRNVRQALRPGGRLCMVVWRAKDENPYFYRAEQIAERWLSHPDQTDEPTCGPGPFSMANADTTSGVLKAAGYEAISLTRCDKPIMLGESLDQAVAMVTSIGPAGELIRVNEERGAEVRPEIEAAIREEFADHQREDGIWDEASTWLVSARVPA